MILATFTISLDDNLTTTNNIHAILKDQVIGLSATPLDFRAGHINPNKAMEPRLIYDMDSQDYIEFLCGLNYTKRQMSPSLGEITKVAAKITPTSITTNLLPYFLVEQFLIQERTLARL